jgi:hypothetical protein
MNEKIASNNFNEKKTLVHQGLGLIRALLTRPGRHKIFSQGLDLHVIEVSTNRAGRWGRNRQLLIS